MHICIYARTHTSTHHSVYSTFCTLPLSQLVLYIPHTVPFTSCTLHSTHSPFHSLYFTFHTQPLSQLVLYIPHTVPFKACTLHSTHCHLSFLTFEWEQFDVQEDVLAVGVTEFLRCQHEATNILARDAQHNHCNETDLEHAITATRRIKCTQSFQ